MQNNTIFQRSLGEANTRSECRRIKSLKNHPKGTNAHRIYRLTRAGENIDELKMSGKEAFERNKELTQKFAAACQAGKPNGERLERWEAKR